MAESIIDYIRKHQGEPSVPTITGDDVLRQVHETVIPAWFDYGREIGAIGLHPRSTAIPHSPPEDHSGISRTRLANLIRDQERRVY